MFSSLITKSSIINICISTSFQSRPTSLPYPDFFGKFWGIKIGFLPGRPKIASQIPKYLELVCGKIF